MNPIYCEANVSGQSSKSYDDAFLNAIEQVKSAGITDINDATILHSKALLNGDTIKTYVVAVKVSFYLKP